MLSRFRLTAPVLRGALISASLAAVALLGACNSGGGGSAQQIGVPGDEMDKPGEDGTFFVDPNEGGTASRIRIAEMFWGRLVDIHDVDATGKMNIFPIFRDFVINENTQTDGANYVLSTNAITQKTRLIIQRNKETDPEDFDTLLRLAVSNLPPIVAKNDDGTDPPPFSFVTRNTTIVIRFDDLLNDNLAEEINLPDTVRLLTDYPPNLPFTARLRFDPNHGGIGKGAFHSTRLLIDMTVSEAESASMSVSAPINSLGLPPSQAGVSDPNVSVRIPTVLDYGSGQFELLEGLNGATVANTANGPVDEDSPTLDVVRAMRSGNSTDLNNGFLLDLNAPEVLGGWPLDVGVVNHDGTGTEGFDFVIDLAFETICRAAPAVGDILSVNGYFLEVTQQAGEPDQDGVVGDVYVSVLTEEEIENKNVLLGAGLFLSTYDPGVAVDFGCWLTFAPQPGTYPSSDIDPTAQALVRFSEPMDPLSVLPFDTFMVVRGDANTDPEPTSIVVGNVRESSDLKEFTFTPILPFAHTGQQDIYHIDLVGGTRGVTDLAGNSIANVLPSIQFDIDENAPLEANGGVVLRFDSIDELEPKGSVDNPIFDVRGQFFYDLDAGLIKPRSVLYMAEPADRSNPVPSIMIPFPPGVQTPLSPLGSKCQTLWRYCDVGWSVRDETKYNVDVIGLNWSPINGQLVSDFYEEFEIRLSHSHRVPDEALDGNLLPYYPTSGLLGSPSQYTDNILPDPLDPQKVVHNRALGYVVNPVDVFLSPTGTYMMPFPLNRAGDPVTATYTWRNTAVLAQGGPAGTGIPLRVECDPPLSLEPGGTHGSVAPVNQVPTFGLPLLMEFRTYPSDSGIGMNAFDISLAINSSARPNFRAFSTGGLNDQGVLVIKNPDLELVPSGGFNPGSNPPGLPTAHNADNSFYVGQADLVIRVSRVHTIWIDVVLTAPDFLAPIIEPRFEDQPSGTNLIIEFRGADTMYGFTNNEPFDASYLDPYGESIAIVEYLNEDNTWKSDVDDIDGARYVQMRFSFINNIDSGLSPVLSAVGVAFENQ